MSSGLKILFCASVSACAFFPSGLAFAATMGSLAPHDPPANGQAIEQWVADPRTKCVATDPSYIPDDSISWQGSCRKDGVIFGAGTLTFLNNGQVVETITGTFADGFVRLGSVTATWSDGTKYQGNQLDGMFHGVGKFVSSKGQTLDGEWRMGAFLSGKASVVWPNGDRYDGDWKNAKPDGTGVEVWADGRRYEGQWRDGVPAGDVQTSGAQDSSAASAPVAQDTAANVAPQPPSQTTPAAPQNMVKVASLVVSPASAPVVAANVTKTAAVENSGNATPNPALPLRSVLGSQLAAVDGATLELGLTGKGFERTLVLPNGNSQALQFTFANGSVGTVADGQKAVGVFRARPDEIDIDYADGTTETISDGNGGGLVDRAHSVDGHAMCTAWYPQEHVFSQSEKQAAVQEYASRLGVTVGAPSRKQHAHDVSPACGGAFVASGSQKAAGADESDAATAGNSPPRATAEHAQLDAHPSEQSKPSTESAPVAVPSSAVHLVDASNAPALAPPRLEKASFTPDQPLQGSTGLRATSPAPSPQPGASDCLSVESNGEYWGFQNSCSKSVQFAYCEMGGDNPLVSCKHTTVAGSVAADSFSALVSDRSLTEKNVNHEFRWMACDGGAGEVVPHLDKVDPPSGRCERAVAPAE